MGGCTCRPLGLGVWWRERLPAKGDLTAVETPCSGRRNVGLGGGAGRVETKLVAIQAAGRYHASLHQ